MLKNKKRQRKNKMGLLTCIVVFFIMITCIYAFQKMYGALQKNPNNVEAGSPENVPEDVPEDGDWCLVLVNKWNPIEKEQDIEVTQLSNGECVDKRIYPKLQEMFEDMRDDGIYPVVASGYRTKKKQQEIYDKKFEEYVEKGYSQSGAKKQTEQWVAIPGTSEHQLGLAVDINADGVNSYGEEVYDWLAENAYKYGFIYRYPADKVEITGVANEPWHYRYVGVEAAAEIYEQGVCLEEYLEEDTDRGVSADDGNE